ncbi:MAG: mechanosensitive ion channel, partial [Duncaniella sp.]|nr:mechanosensitive ion channel [Duncaniella sp.]
PNPPMLPQEATDTITVTNPREELLALKDMSFDQVIHTIATDLAHFAISLVAAILVFYVGKFIIGRIYAVIKNILTKHNTEASLTTFLLSGVRIVLYFILIISVVGILGIETSSFLALFASAGVAVGMALSGTLQNFAGGVLILALKPYKIGDYIEAQGFAGTVRKIEIFNTIITTPDNKTIIIPNGDLSTSPINNSTLQAHRRVEWNIGISYGDNVERARQAILAMFAADPRIVDAERAAQFSLAAPMVVVGSLDDSAVTLKVRAWVEKDLFWDIYFSYNERFYTELPESAGINFPFPQMDVHLDK